MFQIVNTLTIILVLNKMFHLDMSYAYLDLPETKSKYNLLNILQIIFLTSYTAHEVTYSVYKKILLKFIIIQLYCSIL